MTKIQKSKEAGLERLEQFGVSRLLAAFEITSDFST
jgi:hypothetical protein